MPHVPRQSPLTRRLKNYHSLGILSSGKSNFLLVDSPSVGRCTTKTQRESATPMNVPLVVIRSPVDYIVRDVTLSPRLPYLPTSLIRSFTLVVNGQRASVVLVRFTSARCHIWTSLACIVASVISIYLYTGRHLEWFTCIGRTQVDRRVSVQ